MKSCVKEPFLLSEKTINGINCVLLFVNQLLLSSTLQQLHFHQDGASPHFSAFDTDTLNENFGHQQIGWQGYMYAMASKESRSDPSRLSCRGI